MLKQVEKHTGAEIDTKYNKYTLKQKYITTAFVSM